jgi:hypothetical protein
LPEWIVVKSPRSVEDLKLERGETEAIAVAQELAPVALMIDDLAARRIAAARGIVITGTTGVLERAAAKNLLNLGRAFDKLRATTFRGTERLFADALARDAARRSKKITAGLMAACHRATPECCVSLVSYERSRATCSSAFFGKDRRRVR